MTDGQRNIIKLYQRDYSKVIFVLKEKHFLYIWYGLGMVIR